MSFLLPNFSIVKIAMKDAKKYSVPFKAARRRLMKLESPMLFSKIVAAGSTVRTWCTCDNSGIRTVVGDDIDSRDLLKHLVDVSENCPMQVPVLVRGKAVPEASLSHLEDGVFDRIELALDFRIVFGEVRECAEDL